MPWKQEFAASAVDPKNPAKRKGSNYSKKSRICCLCRRPQEPCQAQRQQLLQEIKNLLPLPLPPRTLPSAKAADMPWNQEFAASAVDPKNPVKRKGSNQPTGAGILLSPPLNRRNTPWSKAAIIPRNQEFAASDFRS